MKNSISRVCVICALTSCCGPMFASAQRVDRLDHRRQEHNQHNQRRRRRHGQYYDSHSNSNTNNSNSNKSYNVGSMYESYHELFPSQPPRHVLQGFSKAFKNVLVGVTSGFSFLLGFPFAFYSMFSSSTTTTTSSSTSTTTSTSTSSSTTSLPLPLVQGFKSVLLGMIFGTIAATITTISTSCTALYNILIGIKNTPSAITAYFDGKLWDPMTFTYHHYSLDQEAQTLTQQLQHQHQAHQAQKQQVKDTTYYDIIGVPSNATTKQIKKNYHQKAKLLHPDKNINDIDAATKFVQLHEAYQTITNVDSRAAYDAFGTTQSNSGTGTGTNSPLFHFNVGVFFEILFGSQAVEPYIGQLAISSFVDNIYKLALQATATTATTNNANDTTNTNANTNYDDLWETFQTMQQTSITKQKQRPVQVATHLRQFIQSFIVHNNNNQDQKDYEIKCQNEANDIIANSSSTSSSSFNHLFLKLIGQALVNEADLYLYPYTPYGSIYVKGKKLMNKIHSKIKGMKMVMKFVQSVKYEIDTNIMLDNGNDDGNDGNDGDDNNNNGYFRNKTLNVDIDMTSLIQKLMPQIMEMVWTYNALDIAHLIEQAARKVLYDTVDLDDTHTNTHTDTHTDVDVDATCLEEDVGTKSYSTKREYKRRRAKALKILGQSFVDRANIQIGTHYQNVNVNDNDNVNDNNVNDNDNNVNDNNSKNKNKDNGFYYDSVGGADIQKRIEVAFYVACQ